MKPFFIRIPALLLAILVYPIIAPANPIDLDFAEAGNSFYTAGTNKDAIKTAIVSQPDNKLPFKKNLRAELMPPAGALPHQQAIIIRASRPVTNGQELLLSIWLRSPELLTVNVAVKIVGSPAFIESKPLKLSNQWRLYEFKGVAPDDYTPRDYHLALQLGAAAGSVEIGRVRMMANP